MNTYRTVILVHGSEYGRGSARTVRAAKEEAARLALEKLKQSIY